MTNMTYFFKRQKNGFTLIETLITIVVVSVGVLGSINLINNSFGLATIAKNKLIAADLAQEGFELVRNIRDVNYLRNNTDWLQGLGSCMSPNWCMIDYSVGDSSLPQIAPADSNQGQVCYSQSSGYYSIGCSLTPGNFVNFRRVLQITPIGALGGGAKIISRVSWQEKGIWKDFGTNGGNFEYHLCDWKNPDSNISC